MTDSNSQTVNCTSEFKKKNSIKTSKLINRKLINFFQTQLAPWHTYQHKCFLKQEKQSFSFNVTIDELTPNQELIVQVFLPHAAEPFWSHLRIENVIRTVYKILM
jgi:hypothetical protein